MSIKIMLYQTQHFVMVFIPHNEQCPVIVTGNISSLDMGGLVNKIIQVL
jgi:hypothetical protein